MKITILTSLARLLITSIMGSILVSNVAIAEKKAKTSLEQGKELTIEFCQACHNFQGTTQAGTVAPPMVAMKARFPEKKKLHDTIYDPHVQKSHTMMPPFGRNGLLNDKEIGLIVEFLYTL